MKLKVKLLRFEYNQRTISSLSTSDIFEHIKQ